MLIYISKPKDVAFRHGHFCFPSPNEQVPNRKGWLVGNIFRLKMNLEIPRYLLSTEISCCWKNQFIVANYTGALSRNAQSEKSSLQIHMLYLGIE